MSGYIFVENLQKSSKCKMVREKFRLLALTYGSPRQVRYNKGPQFGQEFETFLKDIHVNPQLSSANNPRSNGLTESAVRNAKILLRKSIEEKTSYTDMLCHFNQAPREDGYSPSELFHGRRMRSYLPSIDNTVDVEKGKAKRELKDMVVKNAKKNNKPLKTLNIGDLCYRRKFNSRKTLRIESL